MELNEILRNGSVPQIGFGPGGMGYSPKMKKNRKGISLLMYRIINKLILRPYNSSRYVNSIANAFKGAYIINHNTVSYVDNPIKKLMLLSPNKLSL